MKSDKLLYSILIIIHILQKNTFYLPISSIFYFLFISRNIFLHILNLLYYHIFFLHLLIILKYSWFYAFILYRLHKTFISNIHYSYDDTTLLLVKLNCCQYLCLLLYIFLFSLLIFINLLNFCAIMHARVLTVLAASLRLVFSTPVNMSTFYGNV